MRSQLVHHVFVDVIIWCSVATKYKLPKVVEWPVPGILAGNEVPSFVDNAGSIVRRVLLFDFSRKVRDGDMDLALKLEKEMAALLLKCNRYTAAPILLLASQGSA